MKKTIRLTESELVELVQRIIKEDEMMTDDDMDTSSDMTSSTTPSGCRTSINKLAKGNPTIGKVPDNISFEVIEITGKGVLTKMSVGTDSIEETIRVGTKINPRLSIRLYNGTKILFKNISGFGQAKIECNNNKATLSLSTD